MVNTSRNTTNEDIVIGRQLATMISDHNKNGREIHPNDIVMPANDRAISRIHCKICYKDGFRVNRVIPNLNVFLGCQHPRSKSQWKYLPSYLFRLIRDFLQPEYKFYLVDVGSVCGTYVRVKPVAPQTILRYQMYLIGADTVFNVTEVSEGSDDFRQTYVQQEQ